MFIGAVLTATSIAVSTRLLIDLGLGSSPAAKIILAAAIIDDVVGLLVLTGVVAAASGADQGIAAKVVPMAGFMLVGLPICWFVLPQLLISTRARIGKEAGLVVVIGTMLAVSWIAGVCGLEALIGAFFAGVLFARTPAAHDLEHEIEPIVRIFSPIFFVAIGLSIMPAEMLASLGFAMELTIVAVLTKLLGCAAPARLGGLPWRQSALVGSGMVPRGEVGLIVAGIGAQGGFLDAPTFSAAAFACVATILFAPPAIKILARRVGPVAEPAVQEA